MSTKYLYLFTEGNADMRELLGGKDYTRFIDPDMERHGIELSDWKGMLAGQPLTQAQKDWVQRITGGRQPQNMMAHFAMERNMFAK